MKSIGGLSPRKEPGPILIAEIGVNHFDIAESRDIDPLDAAKLMIQEATKAGADAVKFQSYSAETLAARNSPAYWDTSEESTTSQFELFQQYDDFGSSEFGELARYASDEQDTTFLSTPFDFTSVDYLSDLVPAFKIASADITNTPLLRRIAQQGNGVLLSTGASTVGEIETAVDTLRTENADIDICLLHCILDYPTAPSDANLRMIEYIDEVFPDCTVGYSDHVRPDEGMITLLHSYLRGAAVIEKHFTLDKGLSGNDHYHAMNPDDVRTFRTNVELLDETSGRYRKEPIDAEADSRIHARRSLVVNNRKLVGDTLTRENLAIKRPGSGIQPDMLEVVCGRTVREDIEADTVLTWDTI
jgi:N-acetylneuraminate synthase